MEVGTAVTGAFVETAVAGRWWRGIFAAPHRGEGAAALAGRRPTLLQRICPAAKTLHIGFVPNQRAKNKVRLGGFVDRELYRAVVALAKEAGMGHNKFGFTQKLILEGLALRENRGRKRGSVAHKSRNRAAFWA